MNAKFFLSIVVILIFSGCGAADPEVHEADDAGVENTPTSSSPSSPAAQTGKTSTPVADEQAAQAKLFCEHEVKKADQEPVESLNAKQVKACLLALRPEIKAECAKGVQREVVLKIIVGKDGAVVGAFPIGDNSDSVEAGCIAEKVKPVVFPKFTSKEQQVIEKYPFEITP